MMSTSPAAEDHISQHICESQQEPQATLHTGRLQETAGPHRLLLLASMSSVLTQQVKKLRSSQTGFLDWNPLPSQHLWDAVTFTRTKISEECFRKISGEFPVSRNTSSDWDRGQAAGCPSPHQNIPRIGGCFSQQQDTTHHSCFQTAN